MIKLKCPFISHNDCVEDDCGVWHQSRHCCGLIHFEPEVVELTPLTQCYSNGHVPLLIMPAEAKTDYIHTLHRDIQEHIRALLSFVVAPADIDTAMASRVCDLEDTLNVVYTSLFANPVKPVRPTQLRIGFEYQTTPIRMLNDETQEIIRMLLEDSSMAPWWIEENMKSRLLCDLEDVINISYYPD